MLRVYSILFSEEQINAVLRKMNASCAPGSDTIPMKFWSKMFDKLDVYVAELFQDMLNIGYVPDDWKISIVMPLYKNHGSPIEISNYRGIHILNCLAKIFEKSIYEYLQSFFARANMLTSNQYGFQRNSSTLTNLIRTYDFVLEELDNGRCVDVVYLDFSKAFDKVQHRILLGKLISYGINSYVVRWISNYLSDRFQKVIINGWESDLLPMSSGVLQGSILGPFLFKIFINDLLAAKYQNNICGFADDTKLFGVVDPTNSLQLDLDRIEKWCQDNEMVLNRSKCKVIHFGLKNPCHQYYLAMSPIDSVNSERDLGVVIDKQLSFSDHVSRLIPNLYFTAKQFFLAFSSSSLKIYRRLYQIYILPKILYGTPFWHPRFKKDLSRLSKFLNFYTKVAFKKCRIVSISREQRLQRLGIEPIEITLLKRALLYVYKIVQGKVVKPVSFPDIVRSSTRGHCFKLGVTFCKLDSRKNFFLFRVIKAWNNLPAAVVSSSSISLFKSALHRNRLSDFE